MWALHRAWPQSSEIVQQDMQFLISSGGSSSSPPSPGLERRQKWQPSSLQTIVCVSANATWLTADAKLFHVTLNLWTRGLVLTHDCCQLVYLFESAGCCDAVVYFAWRWNSLRGGHVLHTFGFLNRLHSSAIVCSADRQANTLSDGNSSISYNCARVCVDLKYFQFYAMFYSVRLKSTPSDSS